MRLATAKEINVDAEVVAVLSELDDPFALKQESRTVLKAFRCLKDLSALFPTGFAVNFVK